MFLDKLFIVFTQIVSFHIATAQVPGWYLKDVEENIGVWRADNSKYGSNSEIYDFYEIEWKQTLNKYALTGKLFGVVGDQRTDVLWRFIQYWDIEEGQAVVLQFGKGGITGKGNLITKGKDSTELLQVFNSEKSSYQTGHRTKHFRDEKIAKSFSVTKDGNWELNREYKWIKRPSEGTMCQQLIYSENLRNRISEAKASTFLVYTPPSYFIKPENRYPVLYLLHSYGEDASSWKESPHTQGFNLLTSMDSLITNNVIEEMIVVIPDCSNKYGGNWYTNSSTTGLWINFIADELVSHIDENFRTISKVECRGIAGHSMGGYGALKIAMKRPEVFSAVYAMSSVNLSTDEMANTRYGDLLEKVNRNSPLRDYTLFDRLILSKAMAFVPSDKPPYYADFLYNKKGRQLIRDEDVWKNWSRHLLINQIEDFNNKNQSLNIAIEHGSEDFLVNESRMFSKKLNEFGIKHTYTEYVGGHTNRFRIRLENYVLPFFSRNLTR